MKELMTGNEAIARGAYEAGARFASAYPGTPSTEILENLVMYKKDVYCEWAPNEKVALEASIGAAIAGARSLSAMKHVGVNVAADALFTFAYTGTNGGLVLVSADDPGMHSSQNEQDNRNYASFARVLMLEPSDSQEAKELTKLGFELSEKFDTPVMLRVTTRICHSKSLVTFEERKEKEMVKYVKNISKYVATPSNGTIMRRNLVDRLKLMGEYSNNTQINYAEYFNKDLGVISSGVAFQYAKEVFGETASYLKLGMTFPLPMEMIKEFAKNVKRIIVVEELDPYIENQLKIAGIECVGKELIPEYGELNPDIIRNSVLGISNETLATDLKAVSRPPTMCAGCPHRGFFHVLSKRKNVMISGDIGCYTLGSAPPLSAMDTCICMGASVSAGHGAAVAFKRAGEDTRVVSVIGDSTFFHSGITGLVNVVYNKSNEVTVILDNRITGMTGHQENPGTGYTLMGEQAHQTDLELLCLAIGIKKNNLYIVNPLNLKESEAALSDALSKDEPSVIITKWPCILKKFSEEDKRDFDLSTKKCQINQEKCKKCKTCVKTGCPAIHSGDEIKIDEVMCTGCSVCFQVCPFEAIDKY
ncbi:MAG: indolepyruvate ferredoxin oxidoreductase subunit alpha [Eubacteriales bacterium]